MAGKRLYITIPKRDWDLLRRIGTLEGQCPGYVARIYVLSHLYARLGEDTELQEYDQELARQERQEVLHGRPG